MIKSCWEKCSPYYFTKLSENIKKILFWGVGGPEGIFFIFLEKFLLIISAKKQKLSKKGQIDLPHCGFLREECEENINIQTFCNESILV